MDFDPAPANRSAALARRESFLCRIALVIVMAWYAYSNVRSNSEWVKPAPGAYYELLTDAIVSGQTYLKIAPDPRLKTLPNPWGGGQGIPRAHDATYFNDRYYIYFGVAPVILLYAPWRLATGTYLADGAGTGVFCAIGFLLAVWFFRRCQRRFFPEPRPLWTFAVVLTLGLGSFVQSALRSSEFYQVPIACAFACAMGVANAILLAAGSGRWRVQAMGVGIACALGATAVGARPNYLFALMGTLAGAGWLWWSWVKARGFRSREAKGILAAALVPVIAIGTALAFYNYARFGDVREFGIRYQFAAVDMREMKLLGLNHVRTAFEGYVLAGREFSLYFPFIRQTTGNIGLLLWAPFALGALALPLTWRGPRWRSRAWVLGVGVPLLAALANFGTLLLYFYVFDRYVLDFLPMMMLAACLSVSVLWVTEFKARLWGWLWRGSAVVVLAYTLAHSVVHGLPVGTSRPEMKWLARLMNHVPYLVERLSGVDYGAVEAEVTFAAGTPGVTEPLVVTGSGRDLIYVRYLGPERAQLGFFHTGAGGPLSEPFLIEPGKTRRLRVDLGSLYPPAVHAAFAGWRESEIEALLRRVEVRLDSEPLLRFSSAMHQYEPDNVQLGRNPASASDLLFRGGIVSVQRSGLPARESVAPELGSGPLKLRLRMPPFVATFAQPLVSTGKIHAGDVVFVFYVGPNRVRFGHDCWGRALVETSDVYYDPGEDQEIEIDMAPLHAGKSDTLAGREHLRIRFNGRTLIDTPRAFHPAEPAEVFVGHNGISSSSSEVNFNGPRLESSRLPRWPEAPTDGARLIRVKLPADRAGRSEPLLSTGVTGAGEVVFIRFPDAGHFVLGYDKWGVGGPVSDSIPCNDNSELEIEISLGSLYADRKPEPGWDEAALERLRSTVRVRVNGRTVLNHTGESFPKTAAQTRIGENLIGASSCSEKFTGQIEQAIPIGPVRLR